MLEVFHLWEPHKVVPDLCRPGPPATHQGLADVVQAQRRLSQLERPFQG